MAGKREARDIKDPVREGVFCLDSLTGRYRVVRLHHNTVMITMREEFRKMQGKITSNFNSFYYYGYYYAASAITRSEDGGLCTLGKTV